MARAVLFETWVVQKLMILILLILGHVLLHSGIVFAEESVRTNIPPLPSLPEGQMGVFYSETLSRHSGFGSYGWSASGLPTESGIAPDSGAIKRIPDRAGIFISTVAVADKETPTEDSSNVHISMDGDKCTKRFKPLFDVDEYLDSINLPPMRRFYLNVWKRDKK